MAVDESLDTTVDQFKWVVYTEMLGLLDGELSDSGYQSRFVRTEDRSLLRVYGVEATDEFPFLKHYVDFSKDEYSNAGTVVHEVAHNILEQLSNESEELQSDFEQVEKTAQILEGFYIQESSYLESLGVKDELKQETESLNDHYPEEIDDIEEFLKNQTDDNHNSLPDDISRQETIRDL